MAKDLKDTWKDTGIGIGHAFKGLGKTLIKTGVQAAKKADEWANSSEDEQATEAQEEEQ